MMRPAIPDPAAIYSHLSRVTASGALRNSERLCRLIRYAVDRAMEGQGGSLKESVLGVEVFGRKPGYDTRSDAIVRVEFARLRSRLREYYSSEGAGEDVVLQFPTGSYVPVFGWREQPAGPAAPQQSIAVLPFANRSGGEDDEYFSDGLTDELITALTTVPNLRVVARTSSFAFKSERRDVREVGRVLRVKAVLEGSVRRQGDTVRVNAQLVDAGDGCNLWAGRFERRLTDVFALQDEIVSAILEALRVELARAATQAVPPAAVNAQAHAIYLRGRYWWHRWNPEALSKAAVYFEEAIAIDPAYAHPHSGLADCFFLRGFWGEDAPLQEMPKAQAAARRALELNPQLGEAWCSLAMIENAFGWNSAQCGEYFHRSFDCNPGYALARAKYGTSYLTPLKRLDEAGASIRHALDLDPLSGNLHCDLVVNLYYRGQYEEALRESAKALEKDPSLLKAYWFQSMALMYSGRFKEAREPLEIARREAPRHPLTMSLHVCLLAAQGDRAGALAAIEKLDALRRERYVLPSMWSFAWAAMGDADLTFQWLERGVQERDPMIRFLFVQWPAPAIAGDVRYRRIAAAAGLTECG